MSHSSRPLAMRSTMARKTRCLRVAVVAMAVMNSLIADTHAANTFRVDDSASQPIAAQSQLRWKTDAPRGQDANEAETTTRVDIRLNTLAWQGRNGRIYMALPPIRTGQLRALWTTQGRLQSGSLISGGRGLVYQGPILSATLEDIMTVRIAVDGRLISTAETLQFYFEIELY